MGMLASVYHNAGLKGAMAGRIGWVGVGDRRGVGRG